MLTNLWILEIASELRQAKKRLKIALRKDYYKILGLSSKNVTDNELKKAYRKAALKWHPGNYNIIIEKCFFFL